MRNFKQWVQAMSLAAVLCANALAQTSSVKTPGVYADKIVLGQSIYLTGGLGSLGRDFNAGANLYFEQLNASGGIHGRRVQIDTLDDAYQPDVALKNAQTLVDEKNVFALFQFAGTGSVAKVAPFVQERQVPLCAAVATGPQLRSKNYSHVFYVRAGNQEEIEAIYKQLTTISRHQRIGVLYWDVPFGKEALAALQKIASGNTASRLTAAAVPANLDATQDLAQSVQTVMQSQPQAILLFTAGKASVATVKALSAHSIQPGTVYGLAASFTASEISALGVLSQGIVVSQIVPNPQRAKTPLTAEFVRAAKLRSVVPSFAALEGWLNAKVCSTALQKAGPNPTRAGFVRALEGLDMDAGGLRVRFGAQRHGGSGFVDLSMVGQGGNFLH
jgi:branched-chain amino acid transport system substrate-binding protein